MEYENINTFEAVSHSAEETIAIAAEMCKNLARPGSVICLTGQLGAGKTTFAKGVAKGLGILDEITSPTFTIVNEYTNGEIPLYHFDCYRLEGSNCAVCFDFDEYFYGIGVCLVEWWENISNAIPKNTVYITLEQLNGDKRKITQIKAE